MEFLDLGHWDCLTAHRALALKNQKRQFEKARKRFPFTRSSEEYDQQPEIERITACGSRAVSRSRAPSVARAWLDAAVKETRSTSMRQCSFRATDVNPARYADCSSAI